MSCAVCIGFSVALEGLLIPRKCRIYPLGHDPGVKRQLSNAVLIHLSCVLQPVQPQENKDAHTKTNNIVVLKWMDHSHTELRETKLSMKTSELNTAAAY